MTDPLSREFEATVRDMFSGGPSSSKTPSKNADSNARDGVDDSKFLPLSPVLIVVFVALRWIAGNNAPIPVVTSVVGHPVSVWILAHQPLVIAALVVVVVVDGLRFNAFRHRRALRRLVVQATRQQPVWVRVPWWVRPGRLVSARVKLVAGSVIDDNAMGKLTAAVKHRYENHRWIYRVSHRGDRLTISRAAVVPDTRSERHRHLQAAIDANPGILPNGTVSVVARDESGADQQSQEIGYRISFTATFKTANEANRAAVFASLCDIAGPHESGKLWEMDWHNNKGYAELRLKAPLPDRVEHPIITDVTVLPGGQTGQRLHVPYATGIGDEIAVWNISTSSPSPHFLVVGSTGGGKTTLIVTVTTELVRRGVAVIGVDPKRIELSGLRGHPGVAAVIVDPLRAARLVHALATEVDARMAYSDSHGIDPDELPMIVAVLDEFFILSASWRWLAKAPDTKELMSELDPLRSIARLGALARSSGIRLLVGVQRPDASIFGPDSGSVRDNFKTRASLGRLSADGAYMNWGDSQIGTTLDLTHPGSATVTRLDGSPMEARVWWTPNLDRRPHKWNKMKPEQRDLVTALTPEEGPPVACYSEELATFLAEEQQRAQQPDIAPEPVFIGGSTTTGEPGQPVAVKDLPDAVAATSLTDGMTFYLDTEDSMVEATVIGVETITEKTATGPKVIAVDITAEINGSRTVITERYRAGEAVFLTATDTFAAA